MDQVIKKKWTEKLRSGEYEQCQGVLHKGEEFCCLGVLTDIYIKEMGLEWIPISYGYEVIFEGQHEGYALHPVVRNWAGIGDEDPKINGMYLSIWNDGTDYHYSNPEKHIERKNFHEIADMIEKEL